MKIFNGIKNKIFKIASLLLALPTVSFAANLSNTGDLLYSLLDIVRNILIPLAFVLALLYFFYGVGKYIWGEGQGKKDGRMLMVWGIVALFVMSSVWGLVYLLQDELNIGIDTSVPIPTATHQS